MELLGFLAYSLVLKEFLAVILMFSYVFQYCQIHIYSSSRPSLMSDTVSHIYAQLV